MYAPGFPVPRVTVPPEPGSLRALIGKIDALSEHLRREIALVREHVSAIPVELDRDALRAALAQARTENAQLREELQRHAR